MADEMASAPATSSGSKNKLFQYLLIGGAVVIGLAFLGNLINKPKTPATATVSGIINFNGIKPQENPNQAVSIKLMAKAQDAADFTDTGVMVPVADQATWSWPNAQSGTTYFFRADGYFGTQLIKSTNLVSATAPADGQILTFNISQSDLPSELIPEPDNNAVVSGVLVINGFIPPNSTVTVFGREAGTKKDFQPAVNAIPAQNGAKWTYDQAAAGTTYDYQAEMYDSKGTFIGQSSYLTVTAPAANEVVTINSTAKSEQPASLSGTVRLQGPVIQNSTLLVLQREVGKTDFTVIDRYPASNNTAWTWADAVAGTAYEVTAALQVNEQNEATGNVVTVTAPAVDMLITIDTGVNLSQTTQLPSVNCGNPDATNHFNARVSLPQYEAAKLYYLQVGTSAGANNVFKGTLQPNQSATVFVPAASPHFARYSYSACTDCTIEDTGNWAGWSPTLGFTCPVKE